MPFPSDWHKCWITEFPSRSHRLQEVSKIQGALYGFVAPHIRLPFIFVTCSEIVWIISTSSSLSLWMWIETLLNIVFLLYFYFPLECFLSLNCDSNRVLNFFISVYPLGWVGWTAQFCLCWRKNYFSRTWREAWRTLKPEEENLGDIANRAAHKWRASCMLQKCSTYHISWCLQGFIHNWINKVDREKDWKIKDSIVYPLIFWLADLEVFHIFMLP